MKKENGAILSTTRAVSIFRAATQEASAYFHDMNLGDRRFFKMTDFWEWLCGEGPEWKIKKYPSRPGQASLRKAHVLAHNHRVTVSVEDEFWERARGGGWFENFVLAHEVGHLISGHLDHSAATKNYQLAAASGVNFNKPATLEELEANYAAVFLQCGHALFDETLSAKELSRRAFSDPLYVSKAQNVTRLDVFRRELARQIARSSIRRHPTVIL